MRGLATITGVKGFAFLLVFTIFTSCASLQSTKNQQESSKASTVSETDKDDKRAFYQPIEPPFTFKRAVREKSRTNRGKPGSDYWQQWAEYDLHATLFPGKRKLKGTGTIRYYNNSPDTLRNLFMELVQNHHKEGVVRNESAEITGGINIKNIRVDDTELVADTQEIPNYTVNGTRLILEPESAVPPGDSATINVKWSFEIPSKGIGGRMGYDKYNLYYIGYWYPIMSVYDDLNGWYTDSFRGRAEFYFGYGNYEISITAPQQWVVMSTGNLQNGKETLADDVYNRLQKAENSDEIVHVIREEDFGSATQTEPDSTLTWHFKADSVRDVAFSATTESLWDAVRAPVGDRDGDGQTDYTRAEAFYRPDAKVWQDGADHVKDAITRLSKFTGYAYPWEHMTAVEGDGIIGGGMEYPMMTVIGPYHGRKTEALYSVTSHELAHMWMPMIVGTNERRYSWMDEGTTTFNENEVEDIKYPNTNHYKSDRQSYYRVAGSGFEGEIMRWSDFHYDYGLFVIASYYKPSTLLFSLRDVLGKETFREAYEALFDRWAYKHPKPWDFFNTFEDVSGRDLDWFWRSWYYETWVLDQAVKKVNNPVGSAEIVVENVGKAPMPVDLKITLENGEVINRKIEVDKWLDGSTTAAITIANEFPVSQVEIDPDKTHIDVNRSNNIWPRKNKR